MINSVKAPCDEGVLRSKPVHTPSAPHAGIWILVATILGSSMAFIDGSVVNEGHARAPARPERHLF